MTMTNTTNNQWYNDDLIHEISRMKVSPKVKSSKAMYVIAKKDLLHKYPTIHLYLDALCMDSNTTDSKMFQQLINNYKKAYLNYLKISQTGKELTISFFDTEATAHKKVLFPLFMDGMDWVQLIGSRLYGIKWFMYWI